MWIKHGFDPISQAYVKLGQHDIIMDILFYWLNQVILNHFDLFNPCRHHNDSVNITDVKLGNSALFDLITDFYEWDI